MSEKDFGFKTVAFICSADVDLQPVVLNVANLHHVVASSISVGASDDG